MHFTILILAGYAGAGKSTIGRALSDRVDFGFVDHQKVLHEMSTSYGYARSRHWLEDVGIETFTKESTKKLIENISKIKTEGKSGAILDAAYGNEMVKEIEECLPGCRLLVGEIRTDPNIRCERIGGRMGGVNKESATIEKDFRDAFLDKVGLEQVLSQADFVVENNINNQIDSVVLGIEKRLRELMIR
jgi:dephospho-CoA kinase